MPGSSEGSARVSAGADHDRESSVLELLQAEYNDRTQVAYLTDRFGFRMLLTHHYMRRARAYFFAARIVVIGSGALLPAVITLQSQSHGTAHTWLSACAIALSVLVAITAGLLQSSRMDQRWKLHHWAWIELRNEGWALAERRGTYADKTPAERFTTFVDRIEALLDRFESAILAITGSGSDDLGMSLGSPPGESTAHLP
jgi:hypothetical protein